MPNNVYIQLVNGKMSAAAGGRGNDDREDAEDEDVVPGPCPFKKKRLVSYNKKWEEKHSWVKPVSGDQSRVFCTFCRREFSISHGGENDLKQHANTDMHKRATKNKGASNIATFFTNSTAEQDRIAACEVTSVYHRHPCFPNDGHLSLKERQR